MFFSFYIAVKQMWGEERGSIFMVRPRATVSIATRLQWRMRWNITSLVQSVNLIRTKKPITPIGLNIFFFASTREPWQKF